MTTYRERLTAPASWWLGALVFGAAWGWIMLVATTWPIAIVTTIIVAGPGCYLVWRYGSVLVAVDGGSLRVGRASIDRAHLGAVEPLHRADYRRRLGTGADARAHLVTRPYIDRGVLIPLADETDPTPYWIVSSRRPDALAAALGHTENASVPPVRDPNGDTPRGEEEG